MKIVSRPHSRSARLQPGEDVTKADAARQPRPSDADGSVFGADLWRIKVLQIQGIVFLVEIIRIFMYIFRKPFKAGR
jgi:hypothetical protein